MHHFLIFVLGGLFGLIIQYGELNRSEVISGQANFSNNLVIKSLMLAIGLGGILLSMAIGLGWAGFHIKPFVTGGLILGGLLFGTGMAILGYCPGTMAVSLGEGAWDALWGIAGGLVGGGLFGLLYERLLPVLGPDRGKISLYGLAGQHDVLYYAIVWILGLALVFFSFRIGSGKQTGSMRWAWAGLGLALLNTITFLHGVADRPIGASTAYPYLAGKVLGDSGHMYFSKIIRPGRWEVIFLAGAAVAAFLGALAKGRFKPKVHYTAWEMPGRKGRRLFNAFAGGFVLIFGARMAGGCTSGHILSGGMQYALSSWAFGLFVFLGMIAAGKWLFGRKRNL